LHDEVRSPGEHRVTWDGSNERGERAAAGVYFVRLAIGDAMRAAPLVLVK
jgi:hypothetical protein